MLAAAYLEIGLVSSPRGIDIVNGAEATRRFSCIDNILESFPSPFLILGVFGGSPAKQCQLFIVIDSGFAH